ncbi:unnamed protein product [Cuscuta epithymum]|uniref:Rab3 GTPase-activating protein catalytic subunit n=1 Tax=Cuscuta epithymum TaxID=186058 RepID=A0AAV0CIE8_9ASTE|nr:unnamed protein product [Cuscuta epithymum]
MASTSKNSTPLDEDQGEAFEYFDDFTLASSWERLISEVEAVCRQWLADGPRNLLKDAVPLEAPEGLHKVKSELKCATKSYLMEYYFDTNSDGKLSDWTHALHGLQLSFAVKNFLVIAPQSASGVLLDRPEATKLLSAVAIALSNCSSSWPAFVPVHDPSRKAFIGIQNVDTHLTRRFEADRMGSQVPVTLLHYEGLFELFVSKFAFNTDFSMHLFKVNLKVKLTYKSLPSDDEDDTQENDAEKLESDEGPINYRHNKTQWDDDCPWSEWYTVEDPIKGIELYALWPEKTVGSSADMAEFENASPFDAEKWLISPNLSEALRNNRKTIGFASQLHCLVAALDKSFQAQFIEDFVSVEKSGSEGLKSTAVVPPPTVLDRVLKDLFNEADDVQLGSPEDEHKSSRAIKGAPLQSLFAQFCLHALWFGDCNIRAIAVLWIEFVREVRWCWEESQPLPRMPANGVIDLSTSLVNQKLHMLAICISKKQQQNRRHHEEGENHDMLRAHVKEDNDVQREVYSDGVVHDSLGERKRRGSAGKVGSMMLLKSQQSMHTPYTQDPLLMTEDMHEERLQAVEAFGNAFSFSAKLEKEVLSSDMSAFKAANPDAVFEDFIRWHSPRDWEISDNEAMGGSREEWPPQGRLSGRMSDKGNSWRIIWNEALPLPASEQKPLLDPNREGEKALHYLETLRPNQLLAQMVCTSFRAAADTLKRTTYGSLKHMSTKIDQLYLTLASTLRCFQKNSLSVDHEIIDDLNRLSSIFEHVEKLVTFAASLHRKFMQAPRLSEAIFNDYFNFYIPRMGTASAGNYTKEFTKMQRVRRREREVVANMFTLPTANQSWRKVLSMGNLLNGNEPILREVIFSKRETLRGSYYATNNTPKNCEQEDIETHRMYICGTSNDLSVALTVSSCD